MTFPRSETPIPAPTPPWHLHTTFACSVYLCLLISNFAIEPSIAGIPRVGAYLHFISSPASSPGSTCSVRAPNSRHAPTTGRVAVARVQCHVQGLNSLQTVTASDQHTIPHILQQWKPSIRCETRRPTDLTIKQANPHHDRDTNRLDETSPSSAITSCPLCLPNSSHARLFRRR